HGVCDPSGGPGESTIGNSVRGSRLVPARADAVAISPATSKSKRRTERFVVSTFRPRTPLNNLPAHAEAIALASTCLGRKGAYRAGERSPRLDTVRWRDPRRY